MKKLWLLVLLCGCSVGVSPWPPNWVTVEDGGVVAIQDDGGMEPVLDAGWYDNDAGVEDAGSEQDAGVVDAGVDPGLDAGIEADAGSCKPGNGWGDKNHCHAGPH